MAKAPTSERADPVGPAQTHLQIFVGILSFEGRWSGDQGTSRSDGLSAQDAQQTITLSED